MSKSRRKSPTRRNAGGDLLRGGAALFFVAIVAGIFLFQEWQSNQRSTPLPGTTPPPAGIKTPARGRTPLARSTPGGGVIQVWFTNPLQRDLPGPENHLIDAINGAQRTIDMAIYNLTLDPLADALIEAHRRGVVVRLVMESEAMEKDMPLALDRAGIEIVGDNREGLMHNKFVVIDGQEVWSGSLNLARSAVYNDYNNLVRLQSQRLAQNYSVNFNEMFVEGLFGPNKRANTPYPKVMINGVAVEVYFSPDDGVAEHVINELRAARTSIDFMVYSFTSDDIAQAIVERSGAGVQVRGVFDESQRESNIGTEYEPLENAGLDVKLDGISGLLHHKVFIIDASTVITGSYNFSANAERTNDENLLIIRSPDLARAFLEEFQRVYANAK